MGGPHRWQMASSPAHGGGRIRRYLIVDDNGAVRHHLATALRAIQHQWTVETQEAERADTALQMLERDRFDALFVSLGLAGGQSGLDLLRAVAKRWPHVHSVVHTSRPEADLEVREAMSQGAYAYLPKPLRQADLKRVLFELDRGHAGAGSVR